MQDGSVRTTPSISYRFLSPEEANQQLTRVLIGIGIVVVATLLLVAVLQIILFRKKSIRVRPPGEPNSYGILGGAICPNCSLAFPRHLLGFNLLVGRLDRCDHCGKWVMTKRASPSALQNAEEAQPEPSPNNLDRGKNERDWEDLLEETKFFDHL